MIPQVPTCSDHAQMSRHGMLCKRDDKVSEQRCLHVCKQLDLKNDVTAVRIKTVSKGNHKQHAQTLSMITK